MESLIGIYKNGFKDIQIFRFLLRVLHNYNTIIYHLIGILFLGFVAL